VAYYIFIIPETKGVKLEEIAALFGDVVAPADSKDVRLEETQVAQTKDI